MEGLRSKDLENTISHRFTVDQFKSKMGEDEEVMVLSFKVTDKFPAIDLMEFIEKGYDFVLDADMSTGEEQDGEYRVFVELLRKDKAVDEINELLDGMSKLTGNDIWRFKFLRDVDSHEFTPEKFREIVPLSGDKYKEKIKKSAISQLSEMLNQGATKIKDIQDNKVTISKPFAGDIEIFVESIGSYDKLKNTLDGGIQLDVKSNGEVLFLEKFLGNYEIHKINNKFLLRNDDNAIIFTKGDW